MPSRIVFECIRGLHFPHHLHPVTSLLMPGDTCAHRAVSERSHALVNLAERRASVARQAEVAVQSYLYFLAGIYCRPAWNTVT